MRRREIARMVEVSSADFVGMAAVVAGINVSSRFDFWLLRLACAVSIFAATPVIAIAQSRILKTKDIPWLNRKSASTTAPVMSG
jgi:hypothetical protein